LLHKDWWYNLKCHYLEGLAECGDEHSGKPEEMDDEDWEYMISVWETDESHDVNYSNLMKFIFKIHFSRYCCLPTFSLSNVICLCSDDPKLVRLTGPYWSIITLLVLDHFPWQ
jgi:hypothetical protein